MTQHSARTAFTPTLASFTTKHNDDLNQMRQLMSIGKAALAADQFQDAQQNFTQLYSDIQDKLLPACLALRAYTCQQQQEYVKGAALAEKYICKRRHDADGYLLAGNMRVLSGDSDSALQVYRSGVQLSNHNHERYPELVDETDILEQQIDRNTRLMRALPSDVIYATLSLLNWKDLAALASTCRAWHKFVLGWPGMWREITINHMHDLLPGHPGQQFLARAPPRHVRKLSFKADDYFRRAQAYRTITGYNWNHLEELEVYCEMNAGANNYMERSDTAVSIIRNCKNTLKILRPKQSNGWVLDYFLDNCPNLECLTLDEDGQLNLDEFMMGEFLSFIESNPLPRRPHPLRQILMFIKHSHVNVDIGPLVSRLPCLEGFRLLVDEHGVCESIDSVLRALRYNNSQLRRVEIGPCVKSRFQPDSPFPPRLWQYLNNGICGLRELTFNHEPVHIMDELTALILTSRHSLEILDFQHMPRATVFYNVLAGTQFDNLRVLRCASEEAEEVPVLLKAIIEASPRIQDVELPRLMASDIVLTALGRLSNLTKLMFCVDERVTWAGLDALFSHTSSLQQVTLVYSDTGSPRVSLYQMLLSVAGCKPLQQLEIQTNRWTGISDTEAQDLKKHVELQQPILQRVTISFITGATPEALILLWSNFKQLRYLNVIDQRQQPAAWMEYASVVVRIGIPSLKIYLKQRTEERHIQLDSDGNYCNGTSMLVRLLKR